MTIDERVRAALLTVLPDVYPNIYTGKKLRYIVYQYSTYPRLFADSSPWAAVYSLMVHLYLPHGDNPTELKLDICRALAGAGCTYPSVTPAHDDEGQHYAFECEATDGRV